MMVGQEEADRVGMGRGREPGLWDCSIPTGMGLFSRGTPAVLDRHAEGR